MLKIAVVDDDMVFVNKLSNIIAKTCNQSKIEYTLQKYSNGMDILSKYSQFHLIFLDIEMPFCNGIETAEKINGNNLKDRIIIKKPDDEIGKLAGTINNMMDRIEETFEMQNRFVGDASHELKTPIAVIKGYADMLDRWGKDDREVLEESITAIKKESDHMKVLIDRLLFLAKKDSGLMETNDEELELNILINVLDRYKKTEFIFEFRLFVV